MRTDTHTTNVLFLEQMNEIEYVCLGQSKFLDRKMKTQWEPQKRTF
jgi:hypothetical protein